MLDKQSRILGTDGTMTRTMTLNMKSMGHVCSNTFLSIFLRRDTIVFRKMSPLHWLTKLTHQTLYREKTIGELLWRQWRHGDWMLKTVSEIVFFFILTTGFKWIVIRTYKSLWKRFWYRLLLFLLSSLSLLLLFSLLFCFYCCYLCKCIGVLLVIIGVGVIVAAIVVIFVALLLLLHHCFVLFNTY